MITMLAATALAIALPAAAPAQAAATANAETPAPAPAKTCCCCEGMKGHADDATKAHGHADHAMDPPATAH